MKTFRVLTALAALLVASVATAAQPTRPPKVKVQVPKGGPKVPRAGMKVKTTRSPKAVKSAKADVKASKSRAAGKAGKNATATSTTSGTATETSTGGEPGTTPGPAEPNALSTKISNNPAQLARVQGMLPQGMTLEQATTGFSNQGQFLAALNASKNQGLSFVELQKAMTVEGMSLGQAVQKVKAMPPPAPETGTTGTPPPGGSL